MEYDSVIQKNETISNIGGPMDYHAKWSKSEKDKHHVIPLIGGI